MPLVQGDSRAAIAANIKREIDAGKSRKQAIAIALDVARRVRAGKQAKKRSMPRHITKSS